MTTQPTSTVDFSVWESRWQALNASIGSYQKRLDEYLVTTSNRSVEILRDVLGNLKDFARAHFDFFYNGFGDHETYNLAWSDEYPPNYVFGVILKQVAYDLEVIQRAAEQRMWDSGDTKGTLGLADELAKRAIASTYQVVKGSKPTGITYFEKSHSVRVFPYDCVALVAVPFTCVPYEIESNGVGSEDQVARDYIALLHELGHYVFWHGKVSLAGKEVYIHKHLSEALKSMKNWDLWCYRWIEEIFADGFGCLLGGPLIALDFQDMALVASSEEFTKDDKRHPVPAIRPLIYIETLKRVVNPEDPGDLWQVTINSLTDRWNTLLDDRWKPESDPRTFKLIKRSAESEIPFTDVTAKVQEIIDAICTMLKAQGTLRSIRLEWSETSNIAELYNEFKQYLGQIEESASSKECTPGSWQDWVNNNEFLEDDLSAYEGGEKQIPDIVDIPNLDYKRGWLNVLYAGGWTTGIATCNPCVK